MYGKPEPVSGFFMALILQKNNMAYPLSSQQFHNLFTSAFPGDYSLSRISRNTSGVLFSATNATAVKRPRLVGWSRDMAETLLLKPFTEDDVQIVSGNRLPQGAVPYASCYGGHQFGNWAGQLGDGRVINVGELKDTDGRFWEVQLKGAGITPYSRRGDGRAVLRPSLREFICSEAMHFLNIPTTRALSVVTTGEMVLRDMFYDGHPAYEKGAVVCRTAPSFLRFGNFEILAARNEVSLLQRLTSFTIENYFSHLKGSDEVIALFDEVSKRTAELIVEWMRVGFVHGVMNTDNMSVLGLTIDYGPFAFLDHYDENFTSNTTDLPGRRYAFGKQAAVAQWNLGCLAGALSLLHENESDFIHILESYTHIYRAAYMEMMGRKLGFEVLKDGDVAMIDELRWLLNAIQPDMTLFFQGIIAWVEAESSGEEEAISFLKPSFYRNPSEDEVLKLISFCGWYLKRMEARGSRVGSLQLMRANNPAFIPRNYLLHQAAADIEQHGDEALFHRIHNAIQTPYESIYPDLSGLRPKWAETAVGCSMLSCSS